MSGMLSWHSYTCRHIGTSVNSGAKPRTAGAQPADLTANLSCTVSYSAWHSEYSAVKLQLKMYGAVSIFRVLSFLSIF